MMTHTAKESRRTRRGRVFTRSFRLQAMAQSLEDLSDALDLAEIVAAGGLDPFRSPRAASTRSGKSK